ncbi:MAG: isopentenyl phosphate kinase [Candidatus Promineofilum sp.]|uniref:isopentenyl phosphate kinase n=1 Tax=Promineifilum sp. TaxID=2664178 RepID=UPI0024120AC3|nr:isopentenyl phosphate kinase [Promineifilum sp.]
MATQHIFLKLGGSLLTEKTGYEALRPQTLARLASEIAQARAHEPGLSLVLGHGSGSFGHVAGAKHGTRAGVGGPEGWYGFAEVADAAARLNRHVVAALLSADVPAIGLAPSASAQVADGIITHLSTTPVESALASGLVPVMFGDVAFDSIRGGTIVSTEEVMSYLAGKLPRNWFLLAGETDGVLDLNGHSHTAHHCDITRCCAGFSGFLRGTDVTGGMASKVMAMLDLIDSQPGLKIRIFSGLQPGQLGRILLDPNQSIGTLLQ